MHATIQPALIAPVRSLPALAHLSQATAKFFGDFPFGVRHYVTIKMHRPRLLQTCDVWRTEAPVAVLATGHDVENEVRHSMAAADAIVLIQQDTIGRVCLDHRAHDTSRCGHYRWQLHNQTQPS